MRFNAWFGWWWWFWVRSQRQRFQLGFVFHYFTDIFKEENGMSHAMIFKPTELINHFTP